MHTWQLEESYWITRDLSFCCLMPHAATSLPTCQKNFRNFINKGLVNFWIGTMFQGAYKCKLLFHVKAKINLIKSFSGGDLSLFTLKAQVKDTVTNHIQFTTIVTLTVIVLASHYITI